MKNKQTQQRQKADRFHLSVLDMSPIVLHHCGSAKEGAPKTKKNKNPNKKPKKVRIKIRIEKRIKNRPKPVFFNDNWKVADRNK